MAQAVAVCRHPTEARVHTSTPSHPSVTLTKPEEVSSRQSTAVRPTTAKLLNPLDPGTSLTGDSPRS